MASKKAAQKEAQKELGSLAAQRAETAGNMGADNRIDEASGQSAAALADQTKKLLSDMVEVRDLMAARERKLGGSGPAGKICKLAEVKAKNTRKDQLGKVAAVIGTTGSTLVNSVVRSLSDSAVVLQTIESLFMSGFTDVWYVDIEIDGKKPMFVKPSGFKAVKGGAKVWGENETTVRTVEEPTDMEGGVGEEAGPFAGVDVWVAVIHSTAPKKSTPVAQALFQTIKKRTPEGEKPLLLLLRTPPDNLTGYMTVVQTSQDLEREWHVDMLGSTRDAENLFISPPAAAVLGAALANAAVTYVGSAEVPRDFCFDSQSFTISRLALWPGNVMEQTQKRQAVEIDELKIQVAEAEENRVKTVEAADKRCADFKVELETKFEDDMKQLAEYKAKMDLAVNTKCGAVASMFALAQDSYPIEAKPWEQGLPGAQIDPDKITTDHDKMMLDAANFLEKDRTLDKYHLGDTAIDPINTAIYHIAKKQSLGFQENMDKVIHAFTAQADAQNEYIAELQSRVSHVEALLKKHCIDPNSEASGGGNLIDQLCLSSDLSGPGAY